MVTGTIIDMNVSHMRAEVKLADDEIVDVKVNRVYKFGEEIIIYDDEDMHKPQYLLD